MISILVVAEFALWGLEKLIGKFEKKDVAANPSKSKKMD
jgi:hypothetical protein